MTPATRCIFSHHGCRAGIAGSLREYCEFAAGTGSRGARGDRGPGCAGCFTAQAHSPRPHRKPAAGRGRRIGRAAGGFHGNAGYFISRLSRSPLYSHQSDALVLPVLGFAFLLSLVTGVVFGVAPAPWIHFAFRSSGSVAGNGPHNKGTVSSAEIAGRGCRLHSAPCF